MTETAMRIELSDSAVKRVTAMLAEEDGKDLMLRIFVQGGGCSGFQYGLNIEEALRFRPYENSGEICSLSRHLNYYRVEEYG